MSDELFDNSVASNISLPDAIARKILSEPKYVSAIYNIKDEYDLLVQKIKSSSYKKIDKVGLITKLSKKVINWEKSNFHFLKPFPIYFIDDSKWMNFLFFFECC